MNSPKRNLQAAIAAAVLACATLPTQAANQPTINLLPTTVIENLKQTAAGAKAMEDSLQQVIADLDAQKKLYDASHCEGAVGDAGCQQIQTQIGQTYGQLLNTIETALPDIERNVSNTHAAVGQRLRTEVGLKMTPLGIERLVSAQQRQSEQNAGFKKHQRLSRLFGGLAQLVSQRGRGDSVAVMASGIYLDTHQVLQEIGQIQQDIAVAKLQLDVFEAYGQITPEMVGAVEGVKTLLFGDPGSDYIPTETAPAEVGFVSDYERRS